MDPEKIILKNIFGFWGTHEDEAVSQPHEAISSYWMKKKNRYDNYIDAAACRMWALSCLPEVWSERYVHYERCLSLV